ncbi:NAD(P)-dependent oxidoreductase [Sinobaca sp. H24]|uniref:NAD(P)-dependent oxidoreductase n=1 Tax=Sinobaca sp. H24 TaxID=2923376 RepID=UPI00207AC95C|nr:NAD(P)-dependent oxidoreductase [Sinobaca sp. H24]
MTNIIVLGDYESVFINSPKLQSLKDLNCRIQIYSKPMSGTKVTEALKEADIVILVRERVKLTKEILLELPNLKMISQTGSGTAHIDKVQAEKQNIFITLTGGTSGPSVVELTFALIIGSMRMLPIHQKNLMENRWIQTPGFELQGKRLGLIGYGEVSKKVAKVASCFNMEVVTWRPTGEKGDEEIKVLPLEELMKTSDVVSIHVRLVPELKGVIDAQKLQLMKKGSVLINTSRGGLLDNEELSRLLENGHLLGAGIDTFPEEPLVENIFKNAPNVLLTPHM